MNTDQHSSPNWKHRFLKSENRLTDWLAGNMMFAVVITVIAVLLIWNCLIPAFTGRGQDSAHKPITTQANPLDPAFPAKH